MQPLKASLRSEAAAWKAAFARNLHRKGAEDLKVGGMGRQWTVRGWRLLSICPHSCVHTAPLLVLLCLLQAFDQLLRDTTARLGRRIEDLDDVRAVVGALREVRMRGVLPVQCTTGCWTACQGDDNSIHAKQNTCTCAGLGDGSQRGRIGGAH